MARFVVTVSEDLDNGNTSAGDLSLREAIGLANSRAGADRITFADDVHRVTLRDALPIVSDDLRLIGGGDVVLDANASVEAPRRALDIRGDGIEASIEGLTITGGRHADGGGGIRSGRDVDLRVVDCEIEGNHAGLGAAGGGIWAAGDLTLLRSRIDGNRAFGGDGGGIAVFGEAIVRGSTIEGNQGSRGGGIAAFGEAIVRGSTIEGNATGGGGGGIFAADGLTITNSDVLRNQTDAGTHYVFSSGGGILVSGDLAVVGSRVAGNSAGDGGGIAASGTATILRSTIEGNGAFGFSGGAGGGILATGDIHVGRSRIAGNAVGGGYYGDAQGGGMAAQGDVTLSHARIVGNLAGADSGSATGGGIRALGSVEADYSVVAGNRASGSGASGGGIFADTVDLNQSNVFRNVADGTSRHGEAVSSYGGGIFADEVQMTRSEVSGNVARSNQDGYGELGSSRGGGISARRVGIIESSITENAVAGDSGVQGGGVFAGRVDASSSTVAWNRVRDRDADIDGLVGGGGLWLVRRGSLEAVTLSGNKVAGTGLGGAIVAPDGALGLNSGLVVGNAAAGGDDEISGTPVLTASLVGGDGRLVFGAAERVAPGIFGGALADNGGATPTILLNLAPANPAIGGGDPGLEGTLDQRGVPRDADPDVGAIEARPMAISAHRPSHPGTDDDAVAWVLAWAADAFVLDAAPTEGLRTGEYLRGLPATYLSRSGDAWPGGVAVGTELDFMLL
jgi:hypothetical protein